MNDNANNLIKKYSEFKTLDDILSYKQYIKKKINKYKSKIENLCNKIDLLDEKIYIECIHNWQRDYTYCGEHSQYICSVCGLYR